MANRGVNGRGGRGNRERIIERRALVWRLRKQGLSIREIEARLAKSTDGLAAKRSLIHSDITAGYAEYREDYKAERDDAIALEISRIDALQAAHWKKALGWAEDGDDPTKDVDRDSAEIVLSCIRERNKMLGLYAPTKQEVAGKDGGAIAVKNDSIDVTKLSDDELRVLLGAVARIEGEADSAQPIDPGAGSPAPTLAD